MANTSKDKNRRKRRRIRDKRLRHAKQRRTAWKK